MKIIEGFDFSYYDCDDTLVIWGSHDYENCISFDCPSKSGAAYLLLPNKKCIDNLIKTYEAGGTVIVWSAGGWDWALEVVTKLGLTKYVHAVMSKPHRYYDDLNCTEFMGHRYDLRDPNLKK